MDSAQETLIKVETLKNILVSRARGETLANAPNEYKELRRELVTNQQIRDSLPHFVKTCQTLQEFWRFIKGKYDHWDEREGYLKKEFEPLINLLEFGSGDLETSLTSSDLFKRQFPAGLPFGISKPNLAFVPEHGSQVAKFEESSAIGVIREDVYPDFTFEGLQSRLQGKPFTLSIPALIRMCQTDREKSFFNSYASMYRMSSERVPVLIPQAWIQWHSRTKANLRSEA